MFKRHLLSNLESSLYDQNTFYKRYVSDLKKCTSTLLIESPFIRLERTRELMPMITELRNKGVRVIVNTRNPNEHEPGHALYARQALVELSSIGVQILYTVRHHRKISIIDKEIVWEGSLNILSQYDSCEIMKRTVSHSDASALIKFIDMQKYL